MKHGHRIGLSKILIYSLLILTVNQAIAVGPRQKSNEVINVPDVRIVDSKDDPRYVFIVVGNCTIRVSKKDLKNKPNHVVDLIMEKCIGD